MSAKLNLPLLLRTSTEKQLICTLQTENQIPLTDSYFKQLLSFWYFCAGSYIQKTFHYMNNMEKEATRFGYTKISQRFPNCRPQYWSEWNYRRNRGRWKTIMDKTTSQSTFSEDTWQKNALEPATHSLLEITPSSHPARDHSQFLWITLPITKNKERWRKRSCKPPLQSLRVSQPLLQIHFQVYGKSRHNQKSSPLACPWKWKERELIFQQNRLKHVMGIKHVKVVKTKILPSD